MKVFVTGASGVIGTHLMDLLASRGDLEATSLAGDIRDRQSVAKQIEQAGVLDAVVHLAALVPVQEVEKSPADAYAVNVGGTLNLMAALAAQARRPHVLYASTCHVYAPSMNPISEDDLVAPRNLYATTKHMGEEIVRDLGTRMGFPVCLARIFSFYDESQAPGYLYPAIRQRLAAEDLTQPFPLRGADSTRDLSTARQISENLLHLLLRQATGVINVGSGTGTRIGDFVQGLCDVPLEIVPLGEPDSLVANTRRLRELLDE